MKWRDIRLSDGDIVAAETTRQIFEDAARALRGNLRRSKRAEAAVS
jgi:hypothetical protein